MRPDRSTYTPTDFEEWREAGSLELSPKFQRRGVWSTPARSFLIDTLISGMPVPPIYLRKRQSEDKKRIIREVIDGQQRVSAVLDFMGDRFVLSKTLEAPYAGKWFSGLTENEADRVRTFGFNCETFEGISDQEVLQIFARLNTYSVQLSKQELRNGKFFGQFKQTAYRLALEHIEFWRRHGIFSERRIARMLEVELTSELMVAMLDGMQDKKDSIDRFYTDYDETFAARTKITKAFRATVDGIEDAVGEILQQTEFHRPPLFYTLFCVISHYMYGLPNEDAQSPRKKPNDQQRRNLQQAVLYLSQVLSVARDKQPVAKKYIPFVTACLSQTDNIQPRRKRFETLYTQAFLS